MKIGYFPGCSLHATSREYAESMESVSEALGLELEEINDWACCGASSAHATDRLLATSLASRTLALASEQGHSELLAPCAACYNRLSAAKHEITNDSKLRETVKDAIGRDIEQDVKVKSIVRLLADLLPQIKERVKVNLKGLRVACYYGCLLARPEHLSDIDDVERPTLMESVVRATGAETPSWNRRLDCCGGGFSISRTSSVVRLSRSIINDARSAGAQAIVVACPMCHSNLDFRQKAISKRVGGKADFPVLFISQLVGLSLGLQPEALGMDRHFVSTGPLIHSLSNTAQDQNHAKEAG